MRRAKCKFKVGDRVRSHYGSRWYGIVVGLDHFRGSTRQEVICLVVHVLDIWGKPQPKLALHRLNQDWLEKSDREFDKPEKFDAFVASHSGAISGEVN